MRTELVMSQNGGPVKQAVYDPAELDGGGGWRVEGNPFVLNREQFHGNYLIIRKGGETWRSLNASS